MTVVVWAVIGSLPQIRAASKTIRKRAFMARAGPFSTRSDESERTLALAPDMGLR